MGICCSKSEIEYCPNKDTGRMGTCCSKSTRYKHLSRRQKGKLNIILEELVTKAGVDFSNPEIQDIKGAVIEMLERIKTWINEHGVFSITRIETCGSMREKTAMWKYDVWTQQHFIEFDFLAVLQADCDIKAGCQECFSINTLPVNFELFETNHCSLDIRHNNDRVMLEECFIKETNDCIASCGCLELKYRDQQWRIYTFESSSTCSKFQQGCDKCTVDRATGTLRVKTSVEIGSLGTKCSLIFDWTSKAKTLCTRDRWCLPKTEKMDNLIIHIDFLPALQVFQSKQHSADVAACSSSDLVLNPTSSKYEHYCFLVPKQCVACPFIFRDKGTLRKSGCRAEIDTIVNKMSNKHRKCYQMLKYLTGFSVFSFHYHLKIAVLHHNNSCSDASENCAQCVFKVLDELQHAFETMQLKYLHSQANLLEQEDRDNIEYRSWFISPLKTVICSAVLESDSLSSFLSQYLTGMRQMATILRRTFATEIRHWDHFHIPVTLNG